jgi:hypothetical protein
MKTPEQIKCAMIHRDSGRLVALNSDLARELGLNPCEITLTHPRKYGRFVDIEDVLTARAKVRTKLGRPRKNGGFCLIDAMAAIVAVLVCSAVSLGVAAGVAKATPTTAIEEARNAQAELIAQIMEETK